MLDLLELAGRVLTEDLTRRQYLSIPPLFPLPSHILDSMASPIPQTNFTIWIAPPAMCPFHCTVHQLARVLLVRCLLVQCQSYEGMVIPIPALLEILKKDDT
jgi:hypothetical protein